MPSLTDPVVLVTVQSFLFLYMICAGIIWVRATHVAYVNYKQGKLQGPCIRCILATVLVSLIPLINIVLMFQCLMAFYREGEDTDITLP